MVVYKFRDGYVLNYNKLTSAPVIHLVLFYLTGFDFS